MTPLERKFRVAGGLKTQKNLRGGGDMDIFWNHTFENRSSMPREKAI